MPKEMPRLPEGTSGHLKFQNYQDQQIIRLIA
jgi:hypothetical protein